MKAILTFDFDKNPDDKQDHARMLKADSLCAAISDYKEYLRGRLKYNEKFESGEKELETAREKLFEILNENGINLDDIYS